MKNVKLLICTALMAMLPTTCTFAAGVSSPQVELSQGFDTFTVSAKVEGVEDVMIQIIEEGKEAGADAQILAFDEVDVSGKSEFSHTLELATPITSGRYYIYISGLSQPVEKWCLLETDMQTLINEIYNTANETAHKTALLTEGDSTMFSYATTYDRADFLNLKNSLYKDSYDADVSKILFEIKTNDYKTLKKNFKAASAVAAFNANEFSAWVDAESKMSTKIWSDDDAVMGKAQKHYNETLSKVGRDNVINLLSNKNYVKMTEFNKSFARAVIYNGVYNQNSSLTSYGHYYSLITELEALSGYNFVNYKSLSSENRAIVESKLLNSTAGDFDAMCVLLEQYIGEVQHGGGTSENTHTGGGGGGGTNAFMPSVQQPYIPGVATTVFNDIDGVVWAKEAIESLKSKGIVSGTGDGKFEPNRAVKREEFIKMLIEALEVNVGDTNNSFSDVDNNAWYAPYIAKASELGITSGLGDGTFGVGKSITREQCCAFIYRACKNRSFEGEEKAFNDADSISEYAKESVLALSRAGIIVGDENGSFNPKDNVTRAQTAVMIYRLISGGNAQ